VRGLCIDFLLELVQLNRYTSNIPFSNILWMLFIFSSSS
jgi:hypothetical protein